MGDGVCDLCMEVQLCLFGMTLPVKRLGGKRTCNATKHCRDAQLWMSLVERQITLKFKLRLARYVHHGCQTESESGPGGGGVAPQLGPFFLTWRMTQSSLCPLHLGGFIRSRMRFQASVAEAFSGPDPLAAVSVSLCTKLGHFAQKVGCLEMSRRTPPAPPV